MVVTVDGCDNRVRRRGTIITVLHVYYACANILELVNELIIRGLVILVCIILPDRGKLNRYSIFN